MHPWNQPVLDSLAGRLERLPHALLVYGPSGIGKLALSRRISQLLLCESTQKRPCDSCDACRWFVADSHPDFRLVDPEIRWKEPLSKEKPSIEIKIDQVRELASFLYTKSHRGKLRVVLIHLVEEMKTPAQT